MKRRRLLLWALILACILIPLACGPGARGGASDRGRAIEAAKKLYANLKAGGMDFSAGPCISQQIIPDWCVDIAHSPRQPVDNLPENQCPTYRNGRVHHFVELAHLWKLISAQ